MNPQRARRASQVRRGRWDWIDPSAAARGASRGFTILLLGGLSVPIVASVVPPLGSVWLTLTSVAAFVAAAWHAAVSECPARQGALTALGAYLLVLPLVVVATHQLSAAQIAVTAIVAITVGAVTGWTRARIAARRSVAS